MARIDTVREERYNLGAVVLTCSSVLSREVEHRASHLCHPPPSPHLAAEESAARSNPENISEEFPPKIQIGHPGKPFDVEHISSELS